MAPRYAAVLAVPEQMPPQAGDARAVHVEEDSLCSGSTGPPARANMISALTLCARAQNVRPRTSFVACRGTNRGGAEKARDASTSATRTNGTNLLTVQGTCGDGRVSVVI